MDIFETKKRTMIGDYGTATVRTYNCACQLLCYDNVATPINPFVLPNLEPKCAPGDPILYPESIFCYSP